MIAAVACLLASPALTQVRTMDTNTFEYFYAFITQFVHECPTSLQVRAIETAEEIYQTTRGFQRDAKTDADRIRTTEHVLALLKELRTQFAVIHLMRKADTWTANVQEPIEISRGVARYVWIDCENVSGTPVNVEIRALVATSKSLPSLFIPNAESRPVLIPVPPLEAPCDFIEIELRESATTAKPWTVRVPLRVVPCATIRGVLKDADTGNVCAGRVYVECSDNVLRHGKAFATNTTLSEKPIVFRPAQYRLPFFYSNGHFEIEVPPGLTTVTVERGFEHKAVSEKITLLPGEQKDLSLQIRRFANMKQQGWLSGDTHIHWTVNSWDQNEDLALLAMVQRAEDLCVINNLTLYQWRPSGAFIKPDQYPPGPVPGLCDDAYHVQMAEEYRNDNCYGHVNLLNIHTIIAPLATGAGSGGSEQTPDYPLNWSALEACHAQNGIASEAHGFGPFENGDVPINLINGLTDCVDQLDSDYYYLLLNCGLHVPLGDGSDHPARPIGCARVYVRIRQPFSYAAWIEGIKADRTFITSGPLLTLTVNGNEIGSTLNATRGETLHVVAKATSRSPIGNLQIVSNGEILKSIHTDEREASIEIVCTADQSRWFVARCSPTNLFAPLKTAEDYYTARPNIAHTSAIYVEVDGRPTVKPDAVRTVIDRMQRHVVEIKKRGVFANDDQRREAITYVEEGIRKYERLLKQH